MEQIKMTKQAFVRKAMSDMSRKKREKIRAAKDKDKDFFEYVKANHERIEKRLRNLKHK